MSIADDMVDYYSGVSGNYFEKSFNRQRRRTMSKFITQVQVTPVDYGKIKGYANIVIMDKMKLTSLKIIDGSKGLFVSMAQKKDGESGDYNDLFFPLDKETRMEIQEAVLEEYFKKTDPNGNKTIANSKPKQSATAQAPSTPAPAPEPVVTDDFDDDEFPF